MQGKIAYLPTRNDTRYMLVSKYLALRNSKNLIRVRYSGLSSLGEPDLTKIGRSTRFHRGTEADGKEDERKEEIAQGTVGGRL